MLLVGANTLIERKNSMKIFIKALLVASLLAYTQSAIALSPLDNIVDWIQASDNEKISFCKNMAEFINHPRPAETLKSCIDERVAHGALPTMKLSVATALCATKYK